MRSSIENPDSSICGRLLSQISMMTHPLVSQAAGYQHLLSLHLVSHYVTLNMLHTYTSSCAHHTEILSVSSSFCSESQTATFKPQPWHILLLLLMHICTQRHSHCCQAAVSTVKSFHSGLAAQQMVASINFLMTSCTVFLYLDSILSSLGHGMSHRQLDANVARNAFTSENKVTYLSHVVLIRPHRQPHGSPEGMCCPLTA